MSHSMRGMLPLAALSLLVACSEPSAPRTPASITVVAGSGQTAGVMTPLPQPVVVEVKDADGKVIRGALVGWAVLEGGGEVSVATSTTDRSGRAQVNWTLGPTSGFSRISATVGALAPVYATATSTAGAPAALIAVAGATQTGQAGTLLPVPLMVQASDAYGNVVRNAMVTFTASAGTLSNATSLTNDIGRAQTNWTLGTAPGSQQVTAALQGTAITVQFTATATAAPAMVQLDNDVPVTGISAAAGSNRLFRIAVPTGASRLTVSTSGGTGDVDLYVRRGQNATTQTYDCRSIDPATTENCIIAAPAAGDWYILLDAYTAYSGVTLRATYVIGGTLAVTITGLPGGTSAGVTLTGPGAYTRTINVSETVTGLVPGGYTVNAPNVLGGGTVYLPTPATQQVTVAASATTSASVAYAPSSGGLNLDIAGMHITQSVQRADGSVPLIAGRDGLLRVFARANALNSETPQVRARIYHNGNLTETRTINATNPSVPAVIDDGVLAASWNVLLPGSLIQPGLAVLVDVDPSNTVTESDENDNTFPASGTPRAFTVQTASVLQARFVPVLQVPNGLQGDVTTENVGTYITTAQAMFPVPSIDADVRAPYSFSGVLASNYDAEWSRLLSEIRTLRAADNSTRYYYGVIKPSYTSGGTGLGYIGLQAAIGTEWANWRAETVAHEWGHNFGRLHVDCGGPANPDPGYPYVDRPGALGQHGWDRRTNTLRHRNQHQDLMSYCQPTWVSDYTYEAVMAFRGSAAGSTAEASLLVWGRITPTGVVLEPAFEVVTRPNLPQKPGPNRIMMKDAAGATVLDLSFDGYEIDHLPGERHFSYAIPLRMLRGRDVAALELQTRSGSAVRTRAADIAAADVRVSRVDATMLRVRWDAARSPVVIVRDPATGQVLSFARGGDARVATRAAEVEVNASNGVRSRALRVQVER